MLLTGKCLLFIHSLCTLQNEQKITTDFLWAITDIPRMDLEPSFLSLLQEYIGPMFHAMMYENNGSSSQTIDFLFFCNKTDDGSQSADTIDNCKCLDTTFSAKTTGKAISPLRNGESLKVFRQVHYCCVYEYMILQKNFTIL